MYSRVLAVAVAMLAGAAAAQTSPVDIKDAWARATPGGAETAAAYATIVAPAADRLVAASTPVAGKAELHNMSIEGGVMQMRPVEHGIDLPAGQPVTLKPGGLHIMLTGLKHPLHAGESFPLTLTFENAGPREITVSVAQVGAAGPMHSGGDMPMPARH